MYLLNSYILKNFISKFIVLLIGFISLFTVIDIIDNINNFIESDIPQKQIFNYCLLSIPGFISIALPMTTLLACIFTIGQLQKNHELTAIKASGISLKKVSANLVVAGIIISMLSFIFDNTIVSNSIREKKNIDRTYFNNLNNKQKIRNFHIINQNSANVQIDKESMLILYMNNYDFIRNQTTNAVIQKINPLNYLDFELKIDTMHYQTETQSWIREGIKLRAVETNMVPKIKSDDTVKFYIPDNRGDHIFKKNENISEKFSTFKSTDLDDFLPKAEEMNYWDLKNLSSRRPDQIKLKVDYNFKIAFSCTSLIMILFGVGLSIKKPRTNYATGIGYGIIIIFLYYLGIKFGQTLGYNKILPPFLSVWLINFIFLSIGSWMFFKIRT